MAVTIADFRATIAALLMDTGAAIWPSAYLDAAISAALSEYSKANPGTWEKVLTLPGDGREIAIDL